VLLVNYCKQKAR